MTTLERDIQIFVLRALLAAGGSPVTQDTLVQYIRTGFAHIAFTASDLVAHINRVESAGLIAGTSDEIFGTMWALTPKGKIRAQQL